MLRELNENEMEMVSGGDGEVPTGGIELWHVNSDPSGSGVVPEGGDPSAVITNSLWLAQSAIFADSTRGDSSFDGFDNTFTGEEGPAGEANEGGCNSADAAVAMAGGAIVGAAGGAVVGATALGAGAVPGAAAGALGGAVSGGAGYVLVCTGLLNL